MSYYLRELIGLRKEFAEAYESHKYADAIDIGSKIIDLYKENNVCNTEDYADDLNNFAIVFDDVRVTGKAEEMYREAAKLKKELLGENSDSYMDTLANLGVLLSTIGQFAEAEELMKTVMNHEKEKSGINSERYVKSMYNMGNMYADSGKYAEAVELLTETLETAKRIKGYELSELEDIHVSIADACAKYGNWKRARDEYEKAVKIDEKTEAEDSYFKMTYLLKYAIICQKCEKYDEAAEIYEKAVEIRQNLMDEKHLDFISVLNNLAVIYNKAGNHERAIEVHERVLALVESMLGRDHVFYADVLTNMGVDYGIMKNWDKSIEFHNQALDIKRKIVGEMHVHYILTLISLAEIYEKMEKYDRAAELQNTALELKRQSMGEINEAITDSLVSLGRICLKKGDNEKAQGFLMEAALINKELLSAEDMPVRGYAENLRLLAEACCNNGEAERAVKYCEKLIAYRRKTGERHPKSARALYDSGMLMLGMEEYSRAADYLKEASDIAETMLGTDTPLCRKSFYAHCKALYGMKKYSEVSEKLKKTASVYKKYDNDESELIRIMFLQAKSMYMLGFVKKAEEIVFRAEGIVSRSDSDLEKVIFEEKADYAEIMGKCGEHRGAADMLEKLYAEAKEDKPLLYKVLMTSAEALYNCLEYKTASERAAEAEKNASNAEERCRAKITEAKAMIHGGKYAEAAELLEGAITDAEGDRNCYIEYASAIYCLLGEACIMGGSAEKAADSFEKGLTEAKARENLPVEDYCYYLQRAADLAGKAGEYTKAIEHLSEKALIIRRDFGETIEFADILSSAAGMYSAQKRYDDAVTMYERAAEIYRQFCGKDSAEYSDAFYELCKALSDDGNHKALEERILGADGCAVRRDDLKKLLASSYKSTGAMGKLIKLKLSGKK